MNIKYDLEFKESVIQRMLAPNSEPISFLSSQLGVKEQTLYTWKKQALAKVKDSIDAANQTSSPSGTPPAEEKIYKDFTSQDIFLMVVESLHMNETELSEYARTKGVFVDQLHGWKQNLFDFYGNMKKVSIDYKRKYEALQEEYRPLQQENSRNEKALASASALFFLQKKIERGLGGSRGRQISALDRKIAIELIDEAIFEGATREDACALLGIGEKTYRRWRKNLCEGKSLEDGRIHADHSNPKNKLSDDEKEQILAYVNSPEYQNMAPGQIVADLADKGIYVACASTFYKTLKEFKQAAHRGRSRIARKREIPTHMADGPNQVWACDITYLPNANVQGQFFYLYMISDIYSRYIVGWEVWEEQTGEHMRDLILASCIKQKITPSSYLVFHSDNGKPIKCSTVTALLQDLDVTPSYSRPRVSNDNAFAEALFKTTKYWYSFKKDGYDSLDDAREWCNSFVNFYNNKHHHSGIKSLTPAQRHSGEWKKIVENRQKVYAEAKKKHPERWSGNTKNWMPDPVVYLNPLRNRQAITQPSKPQSSGTDKALSPKSSSSSS